MSEDRSPSAQPLLRRVTIERQDRGGWKLVRERDANGETFECDDLHDAFDCVLAAYRPDGTPREWPSSGGTG